MFLRNSVRPAYETRLSCSLQAATFTSLGPTGDLGAFYYFSVDRNGRLSWTLLSASDSKVRDKCEQSYREAKELFASEGIPRSGRRGGQATALPQTGGPSNSKDVLRKRNISWRWG